MINTVINIKDKRIKNITSTNVTPSLTSDMVVPGNESGINILKPIPFVKSAKGKADLSLLKKCTTSNLYQRVVETKRRT